MANKKILLLLGPGTNSNIIYNTINDRFDVSHIILEEKEERFFYLKRRIKRLGFFTVAGQVLFQAFVIPLLRRFSHKRMDAILQKNNLNTQPPPENKITRVKSVNGEDSARRLHEINPDVVVVNGTRIISKKILSLIKCPIINIHTGITPAYRGVHGGYWALVNNDPAHCGVTIHLVDAGIDTGSILYQSVIKTEKSDNFVMYPLRQFVAGMPLMIQAVDDALKNNINPVKNDIPSGLWHHPTIWAYFYYRLVKGVK